MTPLNALRHQVSVRPGAIALIHDDLNCTYENLLDGSEQLARALLARGIRAGDRVVIHMLNRVDIVLAYYACFHIGAIACPMNIRFKAAELSEMFRRLDPALYLGDLPAYNNVETIGPEILPYEKRFVCGTRDACAGAMPWSVLLELLDADPLPQKPDSSTPALLLTTAGTTGDPKFVTFTANTLAAIANGFLHQDFGGEQILLNPAPMVHAAGLSNFLACICFGVPLVLMDQFDPDNALDQIAAHGCTRIGGSPFMFRALMESQRQRPRNVGSLQYCISAGDVCPVELQVDFASVMGVPLRSVWGCTEASGSLTFGLELGPVSRVIPGVEVKLIDDEGLPVSRGEVGELLIRGANVTIGYWRKPGQLDDATVDGWFHTGDLMRQGHASDLWFAGRKKDIIIRGGSNISPIEVESVLMSHPLVYDAAVFGVPDSVLGQRVAAIVQPAGAAGDAELSDILRAAKNKLADYKVPERLVAVDAVPRNGLGKIDRRTLAVEMAALLGS